MKPSEAVANVTGRVPLVMFVEPRSASLDLQFHLAQLGRSTAIEWWARRMAPAAEALPNVIVRAGDKARCIREICGPKVNVFETQYSCLDAALYEFATAFNFPQVALVTMSTALAHADLLLYFFRYHIAGGYAVSFAGELPHGMAPWVFSTEYLAVLRERESPQLPPHPGEAFGFLAGRRRAEFRQGDVVYRKGCINLLPFFAADSSELPQAVFWDSQEELAIAYEVLAADDDPPGLDALKHWKRVELRRIRQYSVPARQIHERQNKPKILFLAHACAFSGAEQSLYQLLLGLGTQHFDLYAFLSATGVLHAKLTSVGVNCTVVPDGFQSATVANFVKMSRLLDSLRPDLIHANGIEGLPSLTEAIAREIPYVQHARNGCVAPYKEYLETANAVIAVSNYVRQKVLHFAVDPTKILVVHDELDTDFFRPGILNKAELRRKYELPEDAPLIVMISRYDPDKRYDLVLRAFEIVQRTLPEARLVLVGEPYWQNRYYDTAGKWVAKAKCRDSIKLIHFVADIREMHTLADVVVLSAENEGLGRCIVEAMAMGTPVVVSDASGTHEIIEDGESGVVVKHGDPLLLAEGLLRVLNNSRLAHRMAINSRQIAIRRFSAKISASRVMKLYKRVLNLS